MRCLLALAGWLVITATWAEPVVLDWREREEIPIHPVETREGTAVFLREIYTLRRVEDFAIADFSGFNAVIESGPDVFEHAAASGFWITEASWYNEGSSADAIIQDASRFRDESALIAYNLNDEPDLRTHIHGPEALARAAKLLREHDPLAKTSVTLAGWGPARRYWPAYADIVDILRVDPYPLIANKPLSHVRELVEAGREVASAKPVIAILQAWSWPGGPFPTPDQIRHMVYQALIAGANGISYFDWNDAVWSNHPAFWREVIRLNRQLETLAPLLIHGRRFAPIDKDGIYAGLWMREGRWCLLVVELEPSGEARQIEVLLPGLPEPFRFALPASGSRLVTSQSIPPEPEAASGDWVTDWAGRSLHPALDKDAAPFLGERPVASLHVDGPFPGEAGLDTVGQVYRICPGARFRYRLTVWGAERVDLLSWHDTQSMRTELADLARLRQVSDDGYMQHWDLDIHLPPDQDWQTNRDHLLTVSLETAGKRLERVIRFRLEAPFSFNWEWLSPTTGRCRITPRFPSSYYPDEPWRLEVFGEGFSVDVLDRDRRSTVVRLAPHESAHGLHQISAQLRTTEHVLARGGLASIWLDGGQLFLPDAPKRATAMPLALETLDRPFEELWAATESLAVCERFLGIGSRSYTDKQHRAWFGYTDEQLIWFMESPLVKADFRAETTQPDSPFLGDTLMVLLLQIPETPRAYMMQINPKGVPWHMQMSPERRQDWDPELTVRTWHDEERWRLVCAIPWAELELAGPPARLAINIGTARSIAPRIRTSWHYWGLPFDPAESLAPLVFQNEPPP